MPAGAEELQNASCRALSEEMRALSRERCPSKTLQRAMEVLVPERGEGGVFLPHYWAPFYHNGRGPSPGPRADDRAQVVFFKDKNLDPRTDGGSNYPVRLSDVKHLSKRQFQEARRKGDILFIRTKLVPASASRPHPFFVEAAPLLEEHAGNIVIPLVDEYVRSLLPSETKVIRLG